MRRLLEKWRGSGEAGLMAAGLGTPAKLGLILFPFVVIAPLALMFGQAALDEGTLKAMLAGYVTLGVILYYPLVRLAGKSIVFDQVGRLMDSCMRIKQGNYATACAPPVRGEAGDFPGLARQIYWLGHAVAVRERRLNDTLVNLESAHRQIESSLDYAARIQRAFLSSPAELAEVFPDSFVWWDQRDVVGGDVFFIARCQGGVFVGIGDCTGHGVPGAFMTLIAKAALDRVRLERFEGDPAGVLTEVNRFMQQWLLLQGGGEVDDGMDMGLVYLDADDCSRLVYAGARRPLWIKRGAEVVEIGPDRMGLGYAKTPAEAVFANVPVALLPGDAFVLFSDGVTDQVGGGRDLPLGKRPLRQWLADTGDQPLARRRDALVELFETHRGRNGRRDDVAVLAVRPIALGGI
ncbi:Serine phosphatase RsbU, regulator of sigma subunit [Desulfovibrio sp. DV]|uniref:PP2C family protein-serine/threonine phosphatase n=1 Tax=Desulfovibrio sp. DV TaxID=1844708 RepID=UPI00094B8A11|nr:SpoIIE family protein phosphatase [Desulfovibrio sp. DV]OLN28201.1 Serine phosphatase RsbU, regulator of sigma subunit [Desulfovibrio sp. DV]